MVVYLVLAYLLKGLRVKSNNKLQRTQSAMRWLTLMCGPFLVAAFPRFDPTALLREVLVPADAALGTVIYRLRASDNTFDYPLVFTVSGETSSVNVESLNCTRFNSVCQANVIVKKRLETGRFYDFIVEVRSPRGESANLNCSFRATNATTPIEKIFPGAPTLLMISEKARRNTELGTILAKGNPERMKAVLLELWGSKEFGLHQKLVSERDAEGTILLLSSLDYETKTVHHLTILANDPWTDMAYDTRNIAGWPLLVAVLDEQDTPPVFTIAPPITILNPSLIPGDVILKVHAEDGDRGNPRKIVYYIPSTVPFKEFFNITPNTGELILQQPISNIISASRNGQPIVITVIAEEERTNPNEPPAQQSAVRLALIPPGVTGGSPTFGSIEYNALLDENSLTGTPLDLLQAEIHTQVGDVITLELEKCNGTFDISPGVVEGYSKFVVHVHDPKLLDYEKWHTVSCYIVAKEISSNNFTSRAKLTVHLNDINDNSPEFTELIYKGFVQENANIGTTLLRVEAFDIDREPGNKIKYTNLTGEGSSFFKLDPNTGIISVGNSQGLDAERTPVFYLTVEAADENGLGLKTTSSIEIHLIDINDQVPTFEKDFYEFILNEDQTAFTTSAFVKAIDNDISPPNNEIHYELTTPVDGLFIDENTGELQLTKRWRSDEAIVVNVRAWDGGVPRLSSEAKVKVYPAELKSRKMLFIVSGRNPDRRKVIETLRALTGGKVDIHQIRPYTGYEEGATDVSRYDNDNNDPDRSVVEATISNAGVVDVNKIKQILDSESTIKRTDNTNYKSETTIKQSSSGDLLWLLILLIVLAILAAILLILCCICKPCPFYIPPKRRKISTGDVQKLVVKGSGQGRESKSVQVAEWFGRKEAWTPEQVMVDTEADSLRRHELERGSDRGEGKRTIYRQNREVSRDQLYIREGNADILRLITRGGEQQAQRPVALVADQAYLADSGKEILMRRFIDQQQTEAARSQVLLPNAVNRLQTEHELLEASLRQQNAMLRQIILDRERDLRLETQSLPAGTQTDNDAGTQTEPHYLRPPRRKVRSDNDASDPSDDELTIIKSRIKAKNVRKSNRSQIRRKIKTPILEECELEIIEKPQKVKILKAQSRPKIKQTKTSEMRQKRASSRTENRLTKSALRKEVLKEISKSLEHSDNSISDDDDDKKFDSENEVKAEELFEDSLEEISPRSDRTTDSDLKTKYVSRASGSTKSKTRSISVDTQLDRRRSYKDKEKKVQSNTKTGRSESVDRLGNRRRVEYRDESRQLRPESLDRVRHRRSDSRLSYQYYPDRDRHIYYSDYRDSDYSPFRDRNRYRSSIHNRRRSESRNRDRYRPDSRDRHRFSSRDRYDYRRGYSRRDRSHSNDRDPYLDEQKVYRSESLDRDYRLSASSGRDLSDTLKKQPKFHSETDLRKPSKLETRRQNQPLGSNTNISKNMTKTKDNIPKPSSNRTSRYMEWYNKNRPKKGTKTVKPENGEANNMDPVKETNAVKETIKSISGSRLQDDTESSARKKIIPKKPGPGPDHPLLQHSEHRFESQYPVVQRADEDADSGIALTKPSMAQKKSVFTIAYNDMHTSQIKDVTTPPL